MQRPTVYTAIACFAGLFFVTMTATALNTSDLVVRTFALVCALSSMLAAEATWHVRSNSIKAVAVWSISAIVFGVCIIFYARAYPVDASIVTVADASVGVAVMLAVAAWYLRRNRYQLHRRRANLAS